VSQNESNKRNCDGQTFFGFTVKACDQEATYFPCNTPHECYQFCGKHFYFYEHGHYPDEPKADESDTGPDGIANVTWKPNGS
jgi:hypothetical protein